MPIRQIWIRNFKREEEIEEGRRAKKETDTGTERESVEEQESELGAGDDFSRDEGCGCVWRVQREGGCGEKDEGGWERAVEQRASEAGGGMREGGEVEGGGGGKRGEAELIEIRASRAAGSLLLLLGAQREHAWLLEFFFSNELILLIQFRWRWKESSAASIKFSFLLTRPGPLCFCSVSLISGSRNILWFFFLCLFGACLQKLNNSNVKRHFLCVLLIYWYEGTKSREHRPSPLPEYKVTFPANVQIHWHDVTNSPDTDSHVGSRACKHTQTQK